MGNYQRLLDEETSRFEVVGLAESMQGNGTPVRALGPLSMRLAYALAGDFIDAQLRSGSDISGGDVLLYDFHRDQWATLSFVVADSVRVEPTTDTT